MSVKLKLVVFGQGGFVVWFNKCSKSATATNPVVLNKYQRKVKIISRKYLHVLCPNSTCIILQKSEALTWDLHGYHTCAQHPVSCISQNGSMELGIPTIDNGDSMR